MDMSEKVTLLDKTFVKYIPSSEIDAAIAKVAAEINEEYRNDDPILLITLNGAVFFAVDLIKQLDIKCRISCVKVSSYSGTESTGQINSLIGLNEDVRGQRVLILEDIVDTGLTMKRMIESLGTRNPASVSVCSLMVKPDKLEVELDLKYVAFKIPNEFILGYGLDFDQAARGLKDIYTLVQ